MPQTVLRSQKALPVRVGIWRSVKRLATSPMLSHSFVYQANIDRTTSASGKQIS